MTIERILAAMSGGVDSSVAALLLKRKGYDVVGVSMDLYDFSHVRKGRAGTCCSLDDLRDARRVCDALAIPYYVLNLRKEFLQEVIEPFTREYAAGRTPNPCVLCNEHLKFRALLRKADELGAWGVATGHYAVTRRDSSGRLRLFASADRDKDQSYFLFSLDADRLERILFPVGGMRKDEVRRLAREAGLPVSDKRESQDICFVTDGSYRAFLRRNGIAERKGRFVDRKGNLLGTHQGILHYTVGQRRGLGISFGEPLYVVAIDAQKNEIVLGGRADSLSFGAVVERPTFVAGRPPGLKFRATARIRYRHAGVPASVECAGEALVVRFSEPQTGVTPGQALVLYDGDEVLGGGWIACASLSES